MHATGEYISCRSLYAGSPCNQAKRSRCVCSMSPTYLVRMQRKGFAAEIGRIELLCASSLAQLASSLTATLSVLPVSASLLSSAADGASSGNADAPAAEGLESASSTSRLPLMELSELEFSTTIQLVG